MGFEDRPYYRDRSGPTWNPLQWAMSGSIPLFTAFGIRVRAHASLVIFAALVLLFGLGQGFSPLDRVESMTALFAIVLLHEFGHCFAARWVGGDAEDILMSPLGGLAFARAPHRPLPTFITVAAGPSVNVLICMVCGAILYLTVGIVPWSVLEFVKVEQVEHWMSYGRTIYWLYQMSLFILLFNLLPIFPLDGGQMLQAALWPKFGYYKSMLFACVTGMIGAVLLAMLGIVGHNLLLIFIAISGFMSCMNMRGMILAAGPAIDYSEDATDYSASLRPEPRKRVTRRSVKRAQRAAREAATEQARIDEILAKVSAHGMHSLSWWEKRTLRKATEHQRRRESSRRF